MRIQAPINYVRAITSTIFTICFQIISTLVPIYLFTYLASMLSTSTTANNVNNYNTNLHERTYVSAEIFYLPDDVETLPCSEFITSVTFIRRYYADDVQSLSNDSTIGFSVLEPSQEFFVPFFDTELESKLTSVLRSLLSGFGPFENLYWKDPELGYDNATALDGTDTIVARVLSFAVDMVRAAEMQGIVVPGMQRLEMRVTVERRIIASLRFFDHPVTMDRSAEPGVAEEENRLESRHREVEETLTRDLEELQYRIIRGEEDQPLGLDWEECRSSYTIVVQTLVTALDELQLWFMTMEQTIISNSEDRQLWAEQEEILLMIRRMVWILVQLREAIQLWLSESDQTLVRAREEYQSRLGLRSRASSEDMIHLMEVMLNYLMTSESNDDEIYLRARPAKKLAVDELESSRFDGDVDDRSKTLTCVICIQDVLVGSEITWMPCSHGFHSDCILKWLEKSYTCPMCRYGLPNND